MNKRVISHNGSSLQRFGLRHPHEVRVSKRSRGGIRL